MAFYTSRVDDNGVEIERRQSARSLASSLTDSATRLNISSRSYDVNSSVKYVNPAAYIEKGADAMRTSAGGDGINQHRSSKCESASETQSDIVPPLDLQSEDNYPTTRDYTFSYRKHCEAAKIVLKPDLAYETWLSAKRKLISDEAAKRKKAEEQKRKEMEERKRLAEEKFQVWLESKARLTKPSPTTISPTSSTTTNQSLKASSALEMSEKPTRSQLSEEEARVRLEEWERAKRLQEERRRMLKRQEEQRRREVEEQRRQLAAEAWEKWIAEAANKPKPVPLNRGIFTLRGTISNIYVNPNEWQPIIPIKEED